MVLLAVAIMSIFPAMRDEAPFSLIAAIFFVAAVLHSFIIPFEGLDFIIRDAHPDSMYKLYWFIVIFMAMFTAGFIENKFSDLARMFGTSWVHLMSG